MMIQLLICLHLRCDLFICLFCLPGQSSSEFHYVSLAAVFWPWKNYWRVPLKITFIVVHTLGTSELNGFIEHFARDMFIKSIYFEINLKLS